MDGSDRISIAARLVELARVDWSFSDLYLRDAERVFEPLCGRADYPALVLLRERVDRLADEMRTAAMRADWPRLQELASEGAGARRSVEASARLFDVARALHGRRGVGAEPAALALGGVLAHPIASLQMRLGDLTNKLQEVAASGLVEADLYQRRAATLQSLTPEACEAQAAASVDPQELRDEALRAIERADFVKLASLAEQAATARVDRFGRLRAPLPASGWVMRLGEPLPPAAAARAASLGLEAARAPARPDLNAYLSCGCADRPLLPATHRGVDRPAPEACTCGHACPPGVGPTLKDTLDTLMVHPFVCSGGTRYLPWFGDECVLVEGFAEEQPEAGGALLQELELPHRRGLPRTAIEDALLRHGPRICEGLGLPAQAYRLVCIPFDLYLRLGPERGWGRRELWTHFDGYQVSREIRLLALVGGDAHFGGLDDLCALGIDYDSDHIVTRFAVVRRDRFLAREPLTPRVPA